MPSFNWSSDFTTFPDLDLADPALAGMFANALNERINPLTSGGFTISSSTYAAGADAQLSWQNFVSILQSFAGFYGQHVSPAGNAIIPSLTVDAAGAAQTFPSPNGWHRLLPRTIYTLTQPGSIGLRARFEPSLPIFWYGVLASDPLFGTIVTTPSGEVSNKGKMFDHDGVSWVQSTDQIASADLISDLPLIIPNRRGDYIHLQLLNDLRDAINLMTLMVIGGTINPFTGTTYIYTTVPPISSAFLSSAAGEQGSPFTSPYTVLYAERGGFNCNPLGQNRDISYWYHTGGSGGAGYTGGTWTNVPPDLTGTSARTGLNSPGTYTLPGITHADNVAAILDWEVSGGFTYVSGYAGV